MQKLTFIFNATLLSSMLFNALPVQSMDPTFSFTKVSNFTKATQPSPMAMADRSLCELRRTGKEQPFLEGSEESIRKKHIHDMIEAAKNDDTLLFQELLINAPEYNHADVLDPVIHILPEEITVKYRGTDEFLLYIMAVYKGDKETIDNATLECLQNPADKDSTTLLHLITFYSHPDPKADLLIAELLLAQDPSLLNAQDFTGSTPLFYAAYYNNIEMARYLLSFKEIRLHLKNKNKQTPYFAALRLGHTTIINLIKDHFKKQTSEFCNKKSNSNNCVRNSNNQKDFQNNLTNHYNEKKYSCKK